MAKQPTITEAVERARHAQDRRIEAVRSLAEKRQELADARERSDRDLAELRAKLDAELAASAQAAGRAYSHALAAGWTGVELRRIGFTPPSKATRKNQPVARKASAAPPAPTPHPQPDEPAIAAVEPQPVAT